MYFPISGVETSLISPFAFSFAIAAFCSTCGISGAFLLLPYQVSVLGYINPGVSATNQIFNLLACPAGVWHYYKEGRLLKPLVAFIAVGTMPGVFIGALIRINWFADQYHFKFFAAVLLLYLAIRLIITIVKSYLGKANLPKMNVGGGALSKCVVTSCSIRGFTFEFDNHDYVVSGSVLFWLSLAVGIAGGIYGIGGGAIIVPFLVSFMGLPIYAIAGASLFATFLTSIAGVCFYGFLAWFMDMPTAAPDWYLGLLLGCGGMFGMYCGAVAQKYIPAKVLRIFLAALVLFLSCAYFFQSLKAIFHIF